MEPKICPWSQMKATECNMTEVVDEHVEWHVKELVREGVLVEVETPRGTEYIHKSQES